MNAPVLAAPLHRWVGGKRQLLPAIDAVLPATFGTYYEPFAGGCALFWHLHNQGRIRRAVLADASPAVARTLLGVQLDIEAVLTLVAEHSTRARTEAEARALLEDLKDLLACAGDYHPAEVAGAMLAYLQLVFNGLWRVNKQGRPNVGLDAGRIGRVRTHPALWRACSRALQGQEIQLHSGFGSDGACWSLPRPRAGDLVYIDPPYIPGEADAFTAYTAEGFGLDRQERLAGWTLEMVARGVHVVVSQSDTPRTRALYAIRNGGPWQVHALQRKGNVSCKPRGRQAVGELLLVGGGA